MDQKVGAYFVGLDVLMLAKEKKILKIMPRGCSLFFEVGVLKNHENRPDFLPKIADTFGFHDHALFKWDI